MHAFVQYWQNLMNFASKELTKNVKKTITWHVAKLDFEWNWPNSAIIWYSAWFYSQVSWILRRQFHTRFPQSSIIIFLPYITDYFETTESRITTSCIYCLIITRDFQRRTKRLNFDWKSSSFKLRNQQNIKQHEIINLIDFNLTQC